ncbi:MAG: hypothetical protein NZ108_09050, partial [Bacteroidia bacterium]|nr:hypothetical protein [Bacteroidia bacterium]
ISKTKIVHYSSLAYFPGVFLSAISLQEWIHSNRKMSIESWILFTLGAIIFGVGVSALPIVAIQKQFVFPFIKDEFAKACFRLETVHWSGIEILPGIIFLASSIIAIRWLQQRKYELFIIQQALVTGIFLLLLHWLVVPKIAQYTQGPAVEFFRSKAKEDCYFFPVGYKTYAHYFYGNIRSQTDLGDSLMQNKQTKPVYLICKVTDKDFLLSRFSNVKALYERGGFAFYQKLELEN